MAYFIVLFTPETYEAFCRFGKNIYGFKESLENAAKQVHKGDKLVCYLTKASRWFGVLEVLSDYYIDKTGLFFQENDPFVIRFEVRPIVVLEKEMAIPIKEDIIWKYLAMTKDLEKDNSQWTWKFRSSLNRLPDSEGEYLEDILKKQEVSGIRYPIDKTEWNNWLTHSIRREKEPPIEVSVPKDIIKPDATHRDSGEIRDSYKYQSRIVEIGIKMGFQIWVPRRDRPTIISLISNHDALIERLPLNYDEVTLRTIEEIDVIWMKRRAIIRAFEIEHTTSIYSGILRMADLVALQPNMNVKLHIVSASDRREKVFEEIRRPVFSLLEGRPLSEICTFISYDSIDELAQKEFLEHMSESVLDEYSEMPE